MTWVVVDPAGETEAATALAASTGASLLLDGWGTAGFPLVPSDATGVIVVGSDADLAVVAAGCRLPLLLVPTDDSDLLRMFAVADLEPAERLRRGAPYPADLGWVDDGTGARPFVSHVAISASGRFPSVWSRRRPISVDRGRGSEPHLAAGVVISNAQTVAGRTVAPRSAIMDGVADLLVVTGSRPERMAGRRLRDAGLEARADVVRRRVSRADISTPSPWRATVDGVAVPGSGHWMVSIEAGGYTLWV